MTSTGSYSGCRSSPSTQIATQTRLVFPWWRSPAPSLGFQHSIVLVLLLHFSICTVGFLSFPWRLLFTFPLLVPSGSLAPTICWWPPITSTAVTLVIPGFFCCDSDHNQEQLGVGRVYFDGYFQVSTLHQRKSGVRTGAWDQELKQRPWRNGVY